MTVELRRRTDRPDPGPCAQCAYAAVVIVGYNADGVDEGGTPVLECHRYPPKLVVVERQSDDWQPAVLFPQVASEDWCGEWAPGEPVAEVGS